MIELHRRRAISHAALLFIYLLRSSLAQKGVLIAGKSRVVGAEYQTLLTQAHCDQCG